MMKIPEDITLLLMRRWAGETLPSAEAGALEQWLDAPPNAEAAEDLHRLWAAVETFPSHYVPDVNAGWNKLQARIAREKAAPVEAKRIAMRRWRVMAAAASFLLLLAVGYNWWMAQDAPLPVHTISAASGTPLHLALPDGSLVVLQDGSELSYPDPFEKSKIRWVELDGEAYFKVAPNPKKPFRVRAGHAVAEVIGTSFNVRAFASENVAEVTVESGQVQLTALAAPDKKLLLRPGDRGYCTQSGTLSQTTDEDANALSWLTGKLRFRSTPLPQVLEAIHRHYEVRIELEGEKLRDCTYTGSFQDAPLDDVLQTLKLTFGAGVVHQGEGRYFIRGGNCR